MTVRYALLAVAYILGTGLGYLLVPPGSYFSILWPPNTALLVALLLTRPRLWPVILAIVLPLQVGVHTYLGTPSVTAAVFYLHDCALVLLTAATFRWLGIQDLKLDDVQETLRFIGGSLAAVAVGALVWSPLIVRFWLGGEVWDSWYQAALANLLPFLLAAPGLMAAVRDGASGIRRAGFPRAIEFGLLLAGIAGASYVVQRLDLGATLQVHGLILCELPFLLWAAVRFGTGGLSLASLLFTLMTALAAVAGEGPFVSASRPANAMWLQVFMLGLYLPLLLLASLMKERRREEILLRESEARYRAIVEATTNAIFRTDANGEVTHSSATWQHVTGQNAEQVRNFGWMNAVHPDDRERTKQAWVDAIRAQRPYENEVRVQSPDGGVRHLQLHAVPVRSPDGVVLEYVGSMLDVSDRKWAEDAREKLAQVSRLAVAGELTASIAHEINQPLTAILANVNAAQVLLRSAPLDLAYIQETLTDVHRDSLHLSEVVRSLRQLLRTHEVAMTPLDLNDVVDDVTKLISAEARRRRVSVILELAPVKLPIHGDRIHLQQVLLNLAVNGMEAMEAARSARQRLTVRTGRHDDLAEVAVVDSGPGVGPDVRAKIFTSFFTTKPDGMGLGLAIARSMVHAHGGSLGFENNTDAGTTFRVVLPLAAQRAEPVGLAGAAAQGISTS